MPPSFNEFLCAVQVDKNMLVEAFVPELTVEGATWKQYFVILNVSINNKKGAAFFHQLYFVILTHQNSGLFSG